MFELLGEMPIRRIVSEVVPEVTSCSLLRKVVLDIVLHRDPIFAVLLLLSTHQPGLRRVAEVFVPEDILLVDCAVVERGCR